MKKILALICAVVMALCLTGCTKSIQEAKVGDVVEFGKHEGHNIEWIVLKEENGKKLLLSRYVICNREFNERSSIYSNEIGYVRDHFYSCSDISEYLDKNFFYDCFSNEEAKKIVRTKIATEVETTRAKYKEESWHSIFLPVYAEIDSKYIRCESASYAKKSSTLKNTSERLKTRIPDAHKKYEENCYYWTRKAFLSGGKFMAVEISPFGDEEVMYSSSDKTGVRPMMWVKAN